MTSRATAPPSLAEKQDLLDVINSITQQRLRRVLWKLCTANPGNFRLVRDELMLKQGELGKRVRSKQDQDRGDEGGINDSDFSEAEAPAGSVVGRKRSRQRFEICGQCEKEYDVMQNGKNSCQWHDGEDEPDYDGETFADHDERCHGPIDTAANRKSFPEAFIWSCCDEDMRNPGCKIGVHRPDRSKRVRK